MSCVCGCDGTYFCRGKSSDIELSCQRQRRQGCKQVGGCRPCSMYGKTYPGGSQNQFVYQGYFMTCSCKCDSSYECLGVRNEVVTSCPADRDCLRDCGTCRVDGQNYPGNSRFDTIYKGKNMECTCGCDGSFYCRCKDDGSEIACKTPDSCEWVGCNTCRSDGREYGAYSQFDKVYDGISMTCDCNCDGSYRCTGRDVSITVICTNDNCNLVGCRSCMVNGRERAHGSEYEIRKSGKRHRCRCECDGTSSCSEIRERVCKTCIIDGKTYKGHSRHRVYRGSDSYICDCYCNGTHKCDLEYKGCQKCRIGGRSYDGKTQFSTLLEGYRVDCTCNCNGYYECRGENVICTQRDGCRSTCQGCSIEGKTYEGGNSFTIFHRGQNMEMSCSCECGGNYVCRVGTVTCTNAGCSDSCSGCTIEGKSYEGGTQFAIFHRGQNMNMNCECRCGGGFECTGGTVICTNSGCRDTCGECTIEGKSYKGDSQFTIFHRGQNMNMNCECMCGGGFECTGGTVICTNSGCRDTCGECTIESKSYKGDSQFTIFHRGQNMNMDCECRCGGGFECTGGTVICTNSGCRDTCGECTIEGRSYKGDSQFTIFHRGQNINMDCECRCGGGFECTGGTVICTNSGCRDTCGECIIEGNSYKGDTKFTIFHRGQNMNMNCECRCGGGFECTGGTVICTNSGCRDTCSGCNIEGQKYKGDTTFTIYHRGQNINMNCNCRCGGGFECTGGTVICTNAGCRDTCSGCEIEGTTYKGGSTFSIFHRGMNAEMNCNCECGGSYECKGENVICTSSSGCRKTCTGCEIEGRRYEGGDSFRIFHRGNNIDMDCTCKCGGVYECRGESIICTSSGCSQVCAGCEIEGNSYEGGTSFKIFHRGYDMDMDCNCECGGNYRCRGVRYTESCIGPACPNPGCRDCEFRGRKYPGNSRFPTVIDNINVDCTCDCGGNLACKGTVVNRTCSGPDCNFRCRDCIVDGRTIPSKSTFQRRQDGDLLDCTCNCDGGFDCQDTSRRCPGPRCGTRGCRRCIINGRQYSGNTKFTVKSDEFEMSCSCYCDGSHSCISSSGVTHSCLGKDCADNVCTQCRLDGRTYSVDTKFRLQKNDLIMNCVCECDGAYRCFSVKGSCQGDECDEYGCSSCNIDGQLYKGGSEFQLRPGLICSCSCSGEFNCRTSSFSVSCVGENCGVGGCKSCNVDGRIQTGDQKFQFTDYGLFMQCVCNCDSSYICRGYQIIGSEGNVDRDCRQCEIAGRLYNGNTRFQALINGERQVCSCDCSGRHSCSQAVQECRECIVGGETYAPNRQFTLTRSGNSIQCRCGCSGDFLCEGRRDYPGSIGDCRDCYIFGNKYKSEQKFTTEVGGVRMLCECFCNGGYSCKGYRTVTDVILPAEPEEVCNTCIVGDEEYPGQSRFTIRRGCYGISCLCGCDGGWDCPAQIPKYLCEDRIEEIERYDVSLSGSLIYANDPVLSESASRVITNLESSSNTVFGTGACRSCFINDQEFKGNTGFTLQDGCLRFSCGCDCSGAWNCTSVVGSDCSFESPFQNPDPFRKKECRECLAFGGKHPPNQRFVDSDECYQYTCMCNCDGSYECPKELTVQTCPDSSVIYNEERGTCRQCVIGTKSYNVNEQFTLIEDCKQFTCTCECDGSYYCPGSTAVQVCRTGSGLPGRLPGTGSRTITKTGRTIVSLRPSAFGNVNGGEAIDGPGGYVIRREEIVSPDGGVVSGFTRVEGGGVANAQGGFTRVVSQSGQGGVANAQSGYSRTVTRVDGGVANSQSGYSRTGSRVGGGHQDVNPGFSRTVYTKYSSVSGAGDVVDEDGEAAYSDQSRGLSPLFQVGVNCKDCIVNGESLRGGRDFTFRTGCTEHLCECFCNGTYVCPENRKTDFCADQDQGEPQGCRVGNRVYKMNLFSYTEDCLKYSCRCYKDGRYKCDPKKTRRVC